MTGQEIEKDPLKDGTPRLPRGWRWIDGKPHSPKGWTSLYSIVAAEVPVAKPLDMDWKTFQEQLNAAWRQTTWLSNWLTNTLSEMDVKRTSATDGNGKMPPMPTDKGLYKKATKLFPDLPTNSIVAVMGSVRGNYLKRRFGTHWLLVDRPQNHRFPQPFRTKAGSWKLERDERGGVFCVHFRLDGKRIAVALRADKEFARQRDRLKLWLTREDLLTELSFYEKRASKSSNRPGFNGHDKNGSCHTRVMCKIVGLVPKRQRVEAHGTLFVRTGKDCVLIARRSTSTREWRYNRDDVRRAMAKHGRQTHRLKEDMKAEVRGRRNYVANKLDAVCAKHHDYLDTFRKQTAAALAGFALRSRVDEVVYDDSDHGYLGRFDYSGLSGGIKNKLNHESIQVCSPDAYRARLTQQKMVDELVAFEAFASGIQKEEGTQ